MCGLQSDHLGGNNVFQSHQSFEDVFTGHGVEGTARTLLFRPDHQKRLESELGPEEKGLIALMIVGRARPFGSFFSACAAEHEDQSGNALVPFWAAASAYSLASMKKHMPDSFRIFAPPTPADPAR